VDRYTGTSKCSPTVVWALQLAVGGDAAVGERHEAVRAGVPQAAIRAAAVLPDDAAAGEGT
jgi:hypothetical protein